MERVYEFQTAKLVKQGNPKQYVSNYCMNLAANWTGRKAVKIATMPENVTAEFFKETETAGGQDLNLPVGIDTNSLAVVKYDFEKHYVNCVLSQGDAYTTFLKELQKELREVENTHVSVLKESDIAQVFDAWHHGSEIPLHQIVTLWVTMIALCQAMRTFFAL